MSASQSDQTGVNQTPKPPLRENGAVKERQHDEGSLIKLYMELTGESESHDRDVVMLALGEKVEVNDRGPN
jgi:hypothetical protein